MLVIRTKIVAVYRLIVEETEVRSVIQKAALLSDGDNKEISGFLSCLESWSSTCSSSRFFCGH